MTVDLTKFACSAVENPHAGPLAEGIAVPIEDAAVLSDSERSPHRAIATLHFDPQGGRAPTRRVHGVDYLAFNPWNGVTAHRWLGGIMRTRKAACKASSVRRHVFAAVARREPISLSDMAD